MRKKTIPERPPREKIFKLPTKPSTRSQDRTFTPSPSPPTSPHRCDPMARTKNTPRFPASVKPTPPPKATPSKPGSSKPGSAKPGSSKGKRQATEEPIPEPTQPKSRQSNHLIELSKEKRKLASKHENFLKKSRDRVAVLMTFIDNLQNDEDVATDVEEEAASEGNGSDA
ncbi:extensin-like [Arachis ipaensis]|uniref:extensin-like n=1 Tax=Arachis ipaensis TaxID=130454 RepID=UPI0007AF0997|nr:extensin-like [Arachis ipaensis]